MEDNRNLFLSQSYNDCYEDYVRSIKREDFPHWDYIVLTASNEQQAKGFEAQLEARKGSLPEKTKYVVIPDRDGKRVGSGGATLSVVKYLHEQEGDLAGLKILVIHSGGDSKRVPQYSALGKLFSPVPHDTGKVSTLFDEFMICMSSVPSRIKEGMLLLSGDVLLLFNPLQIDCSSDATAISFKEHVETGKNHGVFLYGEGGYVKRFLHKQTVDTLREVGAVNEQGCVDIDTGAIIFSTAILESLYSLVATDELYDRYVNDKVRLSLYGDFLYPLALDSDLNSFYAEKPEGDMCHELLDARKVVWEALSGYRLKLLRLAPAKFIHFGTTAEILKLMSGGVDDYSVLGWKRIVGSSVRGKACAAYNSVLASGAVIGDNCYLEVSNVQDRAKVGSNVILSYIDIRDEVIPSDVVVHGLKQKNGRFVVRIYGIHDNPKENVLFGRDLDEVERSTGVKLWESSEHSLWNANIYPEMDTIAEALAESLKVYSLFKGEAEGYVASWSAATRRSLCSGFNAADPDAIIAWDARMADLVKMDEIAKAIDDKVPAKSLPTMSGLSKIQKEWMDDKLAGMDYSGRMRLFYYMGTVLQDEGYIQRCFDTIQEAILESTLKNLSYNDTLRITKEAHEVFLPLRVNVGGGWSDTPPYCNENGGTVLNIAIELDGKKPVSVKLERIDERKIVFDSRDMDVHGEFSTIEPLQQTGDPFDPFALQKACLLACGIIPKDGGDLGEILTRLGGGFVMHSEVTGVPKGSGLGTSSILSAACVKAMFEFVGMEYTEDDLYSTVLAMEQIMSTGGGWQDQVGGVTPGIKYITTLPGIDQRIKVSHLQLSEETKAELEERFILVYTGQRRLARNLLRDVIGRYVGNEPESLYALNEIQRVAALMRFELERGRVDEFAKLFDFHWELSKKVDSGSTNTLIDQIFASIDDLIDGKLVCGAGGGGFLQIMMKKGVTRDMVRARLKGVFMDSLVDVWDSNFVWE